MKEAKNAAESALLDNQRAAMIRATKMNAAPRRLFVDFLFVALIDSISSSWPDLFRPSTSLRTSRRGCPP
jgi:hypothetical protein